MAIKVKIPAKVAGAKVEVHGEPLLSHGETWVTLCPVDLDDERLWEFSVTSGRLLQTRA
jgi:hypothetical protein